MVAVLLLLLVGYLGSYVLLRVGVGSHVHRGSGFHTVIIVKTPIDRLIPVFRPCIFVETRILGRPISVLSERMIPQ